MKKKLFLFITPDGATYSSPDKIYPNVDNFQVLGESEGWDEEDAFKSFIEKNKWVLEANFNEVICIEAKYLKFLKVEDLIWKRKIDNF